MFGKDFLFPCPITLQDMSAHRFQHKLSNVAFKR